MTKRVEGHKFVKFDIPGATKLAFAKVCHFYGIAEAQAMRLMVTEWIAEWDSRHGKKKQQSGDDGLEHKRD
jgi:hypothetical protein